MSATTMTKTVKARNLEFSTRYMVEGREVQTVEILMDRAGLIVWDVIDVDGYHDTAYFEPGDDVEVI